MVGRLPNHLPPITHFFSHLSYPYPRYGDDVPYKTPLPCFNPSLDFCLRTGQADPANSGHIHGIGLAPGSFDDPPPRDSHDVRFFDRLITPTPPSLLSGLFSPSNPFPPFRRLQASFVRAAPVFSTPNLNSKHRRKFFLRSDKLHILAPYVRPVQSPTWRDFSCSKEVFPPQHCPLSELDSSFPL